MLELTYFLIFHKNMLRIIIFLYVANTIVNTIKSFATGNTQASGLGIEPDNNFTVHVVGSKETFLDNVLLIMTHPLQNY